MNDEDHMAEGGIDPVMWRLSIALELDVQRHRGEMAAQFACLRSEACARHEYLDLWAWVKRSDEGRRYTGIARRLTQHWESQG